MKLATVLVVVAAMVLGSRGYISPEKDLLLSDIFLREVMNRMGKDLTRDSGYLMDFPDGKISMGARSLGKTFEDESQLFPVDYDTFLGGGETGGNAGGDIVVESGYHPSLRDPEYLQHSSLWGSQLVSGGAGEGAQRLKPEGSLKNKQEIKTDATLPAYCNPPNPCPLGYAAENGCLEDFENTASFSRRYQASQDCMCDSEHMFDCPNPGDSSPDEDALEALNELEFNRFLQRTMQGDPSLQHKNLVAKKFHTKKSYDENPFLAGERLPVAAKKGNKVY